MSDIFLSYAQEDTERARALAGALERRGWSVFWDRRIPPGRDFQEVLLQSLDQARCVIVLWSRLAVQSSWVIDEASEALSRGVLVPATIEDVRVPLGFRALQSADLSGWSGGTADRELEQLFLRVAHHVPAPASPAPSPLPIPPRRNVFISYAREDGDYVNRLAAHLRSNSITVWADHSIEYGDLWWRTIVENIRNCVAMVVVMTSASEQSKWVEREILFADSLAKPILPLLLQGTQFPLLITMQYHDVTDMSMPSTEFLNTLQRLMAS